MSAFGAPRHVHAASSPKVPLSSKLAEVKRRVPFLASASSDLDEAYDRTYDGDAESLVLSPSRPSPRKVLEQERSRSLVGYTPVSSFDLDLLTLDAPVRTSTPVFGRSTSHVPAQTPPPYSVSDVSDSHSLELDDEDSRLIEGLKTPRPPVRLEVEDIDPAVLAELERRADEFYHTGLVGRCWDVWVQSNDWVRVSWSTFR
jgi:protein SFI1